MTEDDDWDPVTGTDMTREEVKLVWTGVAIFALGMIVIIVQRLL